MKTKIFSALISATIILSSAVKSSAMAAASIDSLNVPTFGKVYIFNRTTTPQNVIVVISGHNGWRLGVMKFSETFSGMNTLVIGVDVVQYLKGLKIRTDECYNVAADFIQLTSLVEEKFDFPDYRPPVIMGYSSGATLTYAILSEALPGTFIGGISMGFCPGIELPAKFCEINGLTETTDVPGKRYLLQPDDKLGNPWIVLNGKIDKECSYASIEEFVSKTKDAELITLQKTGHGLSKWSDYMPQWKDAYSRLIERYEKEKPPGININEIKNLPLIITNSKIRDKQAPVVLLISGDGGWYGFEQSIADNLATLGIPTIGFDSKKYFWKRRTPEETSSAIAKALNYYCKEWGRDKFVLIGYSLGAEIVPFIVNRLPKEMKSRIGSAVLLSPAETTDFEIHISNMLGMGNRKNTYITTDEIIRMKNTHTLIILGDGEKSVIPELLSGTPVIIRKIPGDHHYKFNLPLIIQTMRDNKVF